jgi:phosphonate transport system substrate-binding protein
MGPWGYVLANNEAGAQVVSTILYDGKPEYFAIMVTHPNSGIHSVADLKGRTFAFGDKGSTSGYLIPLHYFMTQGINPDTYFAKVLHTSTRRSKPRSRRACSMPAPTTTATATR